MYSLSRSINYKVKAMVITLPVTLAIWLILFKLELPLPDWAFNIISPIIFFSLYYYLESRFSKESSKIKPIK